ncbi:chloride channel [Rhizina undulata]
MPHRPSTSHSASSAHRFETGESSTSPPRPTVTDVPEDGSDPLGAFQDLDSDLPDSNNRITFKRRHRALSRYSIFTPTVPSSSTTPPQSPPPYNGPKDNSYNSDPWIHEGPGRRVYDDLTAIDWIFEYTKERVRTRTLARQTGLIGYFERLLDSSQVWIVLILTGIATGLLAAGIDVVTHWLGDLKDGVCTTSFYLSRSFCCWGIDASESCRDWVSWSRLLGVESRGGGYIVKYLFYIIFSIIFAASASFLVKSFALYARHSGIPEIKTVLGGFVIRRFMGTWTLIVKSIGLCLSVASGLWLGKEGPLVHVACCCANLFMKPFEALSKNEARKREILSAASAAGISVAFGSPIGGVLFSLEQLSYYFPDKTMWQSFVAAMVAAVTLQFMNPFRTGKLVLYQTKYTRSWHDFEIIPFCVLGVLGGLYGAFFIKLNMAIASWRKTSPIRSYPVLEVVLVALVTALINFPVVFMRPQSSELVANLFQECSPDHEDFLSLCMHSRTPLQVFLLLFSAVLGALLASATFGLLIPAGIILPSMAIGALYGRAMGMVVQAWQVAHPSAWIFRSCEPDVQCVTPGVFAIIGAASALGGVTRMTVSIVVIMFELTGALTYVLPIMIAVMLSKWTGDAFSTRGIYESWIRFKEYPFLDNNHDVPIPDVPVSEVMTRIEDLVVVTESGHSIDSLENLLGSQPYKGFPIVSDTRTASLVGYISRSELRFALDRARNVAGLPGTTECSFSGSGGPRTDGGNAVGGFMDLRPWMDQTPITLSPAASLMLAANMFQKLGLRYVLFATHGQLQGLLTKKDVFFVLNSEEREVAYDVEESGREGRRLLESDGESVASEGAGLIGL